MQLGACVVRFRVSCSLTTALLVVVLQLKYFPNSSSNPNPNPDPNPNPSFTNAVMIMDFATDYALSEALLGGASQSDVALLYSLFLLCVMPAMFLAAY